MEKKIPRFLAAAKEFNLGQDTLLEILKNNHFVIKNLRPSSRLTEQMYEHLKLELGGKNFQAETYKEPILYLQDNIFYKQKMVIKYNEFDPINSYFENKEAINICSKMSSSFTRRLCNNLNNPKQDNALLIYQIHFIANNALKIFGGSMLTFIYGLRNLKFKNSKALETQTYSKVVPSFPIITFISNDTSFNIAFFVKRNNLCKLTSDIRGFYKSQHIGIIDEQGFIVTKFFIIFRCRDR